MNCARVTGGSRGLGKAICVQLAEDHSLHILLNYSSDDAAASATLKEIVGRGGSAELLHFNVAEKAGVDSTISKWIENNPDKSISVLVNNAGITRDDLLVWMPEESWNEVLDVSLKGLFNVTQNVLEHMLSNKYGRIINISSYAGIKGVAGQSNYSAAKAGIIGATKSLAVEVARMGITVNAIAPGYFNTEMTESEQVKEFTKKIPVRRMGKPEELAHLVSFLSSEKAAYITGEVINISGGLSA